LYLGPSPVETAIVRCEEIRTEVQGHLISEAAVLRPLGALHGFAGDFQRSRSCFATSAAIVAELGLGLSSASSYHEATTEMLAGNYAHAESRLRAEYERLQAMGESSIRSTTAALLARAAIAQSDFAEAERFANVSEELAQPDDLLTQIMWRGVRARLLAQNDQFAAAERIGRDAVTLAAQTDFTSTHADALVDLASVLGAAGRRQEASILLGEAVELYEEKGNAPAAAQARQPGALSIA
jgi:tetratricopeptide (TPR) repeat protein